MRGRTFSGGIVSPMSTLGGGKLPKCGNPIARTTYSIPSVAEL